MTTTRRPLPGPTRLDQRLRDAVEKAPHLSRASAQEIDQLASELEQIAGDLRILYVERLKPEDIE